MLLSETDVKLIPRECKRLGKQTGNKTRPLKVEMESLRKKNKVMMSLNKLKNTECEQLQRISVTDDYTIEEREEIKRWAEKGKDKNQDESCDSKFAWRVRGKPKKRITPRKNSQEITKQTQLLVNYDNIVIKESRDKFDKHLHINTVNIDNENHQLHCKLINSRSVGNKAPHIIDLITEIGLSNNYRNMAL